MRLKIDRRLLALMVAIGLVIWFGAAALSSAEDKDTYISEEYKTYCEMVGEKYGVCPELLEAIIESESSGRANAVNGNCKGLMQVNARGNVFDPYTNIDLGCQILLDKADYVDGDIAGALMLYHGESNAISKWEKGKISPYAAKILERSAELERIHNK